MLPNISQTANRVLKRFALEQAMFLDDDDDPVAMAWTE